MRSKGWIVHIHLFIYMYMHIYANMYIYLKASFTGIKTLHPKNLKFVCKIIVVMMMFT